MSDTDEITRLRADNVRLREDAEFNYMTGFDVAKSEYCTMVQKLEDENERLRAALKPFVCDCEGEAICIGECMHRNARATLDGQPAQPQEGA